MKNFNRNLLFLALAILAILLVGCTPTPTYQDYYVSIQGSNSGGNGSQSKPWRTINYALNQANYIVSSTVRIHLAKGIYNENLIITDDVVIVGAGSSETVSVNANNLEMPNQQVSVIARQPVSDKAKSVDVKGAEVTLENLNIMGGLVRVRNSDFTMQNVIVYGVQGGYGVEIVSSSFSIIDSRIVTQKYGYSDYGLYTIASSGYFTNSYVGNRFDHAINIVPWCKPAAGFLLEDCPNQTIDMYNLPAPINVYITGASVEGSSIFYADGIRIGVANVVIKNSKITRAPGGEPAGSGNPWDPPYAGIELGAYIVEGNKMRRVEIINTEISGFDVGIGVSIETLELKVEGSKIQGLTYGVQTNYFAYSETSWPTVDLGGGPLGSGGKNVFSNLPKYAYYHDTGPYDVWACYNTWNVMTKQIDTLRIYDKLDKSTLGKVKWDCLGAPAGPTQPAPIVATVSPTPKELTLVAIPKQNANCREGNSASLFDIADTLFAGEEYTPIGRGPDNLWLAFIGPVTRVRCWVYVEPLRLLLNGNEVDLAGLPETVLPFIPYPVLPSSTATEKPQPRATSTSMPLTQCSDGIDNDGDGYIDLADRGCSGPADDSE